MKNKIFIFYQKFSSSTFKDDFIDFIEKEKFIDLKNIKYPLISFDNKFLSSKYNPEVEALRITEKVLLKENNLIILYQISNIFLIETILNSEEYKDFLIIEFSENIVKILKKYFSKNIDITYFDKSNYINKIKSNYDNKNIYILVNPDKEILKKTLLNIDKDNFIKFPPNKVIQKYFQNIDLTIDSILNQKKINFQTISKFGYQWIKNSLLNLEKYIFNKGIKTFFNFANGLNILIIGGGPSLYYNIEQIKKIYPFILIIAVDTAYRPLIKNGIIPDFIVSFDSQSINSSYILTTKNFEPILLTVPTVNPILIKKFSGKIVFSSIFFDFIQKIDRLTFPKFEILSGGTVTSSAYDFAKLMKPDNIYFIGLDLCYSYNLNHSKYSLYEDLFYYFQNFFNTYEKLFLSTILNGTTYFDKDLSGRLVRTDIKFKMFADWFASEINKNTFFLTDRILNMPSFKFKNLEHLYGELKNNKSIANKIRKQRGLLKSFKVNIEIEPDKKNKILLSVVKFLNNTYQELEELSNIFMSAKNLSFQIKKYYEKNLNVDNFLYNLDLFEKKIKQYSVGLYIINLASQKIINSIHQNYKKDKSGDEIIKENIDFYSTMFKLSKEILQISKKTIISFEKNI